jgi:hypothetical protein
MLTAPVRASYLRTLRIQVNEDAIIEAAEREPWGSSRDITRELRPSHPMTISCIHATTHGVHICSRRWSSMDAILPWVGTSTHCQCAPFRQLYVDRMCLWVYSASRAVTFCHGIMIMLSANLHVKSLLSQCFGLESSATMSCAPVCYLTGLQLNYIVNFGNCSTGAAWSCSSSCEAEFVVSAQRNSRTLWGRCPAMLDTDISRKVHSKSRANCMSSLIVGSNSDGFPPAETLEGTRVMQPFPRLPKISWQ